MKKFVEMIWNDPYEEKSIPFCGIQHSAIMADFLMPETQQLYNVVITFIISLCFKGSCRTLGIHSAISFSFYVSYK